MRVQIFLDSRNGLKHWDDIPIIPRENEAINITEIFSEDVLEKDNYDQYDVKVLVVTLRKDKEGYYYELFCSNR